MEKEESEIPENVDFIGGKHDMKLFQCRKCAIKMQCISWLRWYQKCDIFRPYFKEIIEWLKQYK